MKILLIEDEQYESKAYISFLQARGHEVILAENLPQAIAAIDEHKDIDGVLCDFEFPSKEGGNAISTDERIEQIRGALPENVWMTLWSTARLNDDKWLSLGVNSVQDKRYDPEYINGIEPAIAEMEDGIAALQARDYKKKVLLVEDHPEWRNILSDELVENGYQVVVAENRDEGIQKFKDLQDKLDLVVTDMNMPAAAGGYSPIQVDVRDENGFQIVQFIRDKIGNKDIPIIAASSVMQIDERRPLTEAGATACIDKSKAELKAALAELTGDSEDRVPASRKALEEKKPGGGGSMEGKPQAPFQEWSR